MASHEVRVSIPVDEAFAWTGGKPTVLVVVADESLRTAAARVVEDAGYRVRTAAHSGHAVLAGLTERRIDVVIADYGMNDTTGPVLAERLRRHHPSLQTLYVAEHGTPTPGVLVRPFTSGDLLEGIDGVLAPAAS